MVDDYFDGIYAQVRPRPRLSVIVYVGVSLYDPRVHVMVLHCYLNRKLQLAFSTPDLVYLPTFPSVFCCGLMWNLDILFHDYYFLQA